MKKRDPIAPLAGRCNGPAWDTLKAIRHFSDIDLIVGVLQRREGTILEHDIAAAISEVMTAREKRSSGKPGALRSESQDC